MNIKLIIISRLFCANGELGCTNDCEEIVNDKRQMHYHSLLASMTIARSLRNQTDDKFTHYTIIHDRANPDLMKEYSQILMDSGLNTILIPYSEYESELIKSYKENDAVCFSSMDPDDLVNNNAVALAKKAYVPGRLTIHGYNHGLEMNPLFNSCRWFDMDYKGIGHIRIMQSFLFDKTTKFYNPYHISHIDPISTLIKTNDKFVDDNLIKYGDKDCANELTYVYIRHSKSESFRKFNTSGTHNSKLVKSNIFPKEITSEMFEHTFGISSSELAQNFKKIYEQKL